MRLPEYCHYEGDLPTADNWYRNLSFVRIIGSLDDPLVIMAEWFRAIRCNPHFEHTYPRPEHIARLGGNTAVGF